MITETVITGIVSFLVGWNLPENYTKRQLKKHVTRRMEAASDEPEIDRIQIRVEKHGDTLIAYRADNNRFLSQSDNGKELVNQLSEIFTSTANNHVKITIHEEEGAEYIRQYFEKPE